MKITILALHLGYGGIEKFISNIANMFAKDNNVEIISIYKLYDKPPFYIDSNVKITYLLEDLKPNRDEFYRSIKSCNIIEFLKQTNTSIRILYLKKHIMKKTIKELKSDVVISTIPPHNKLLSKYGKKEMIKIATEHNYKDNNKRYIDSVIRSCMGMDYLVIASKKLSKKYTEKMVNKKCKVVNIPLGIDDIPTKVSKLDKKAITYIGRLSKEKGVMDLIDVFKKVYEKDNEFVLNIIGDGELKRNLTDKIKKYHLENNVILHGYKRKSEIEDILLETSIGINTSYTESFGLAIIETFSYGIPCVAFDSAEGAVEIIDDDKNGYIILERNFDEMANKIVKLVADKEKSKQFAKNAREKSLEYDSERIRLKWDRLIK